MQGRQVGTRPVRLPANDQGKGLGEIGLGEGFCSVCISEEDRQGARQALNFLPRQRMNGDVKMCAHARANDFRGEGVSGFWGEEERFHARGGGGPKDSAEVARVTYPVEDQQKSRIRGERAGLERENGKDTLRGLGIAGGLHDPFTHREGIYAPSAEPGENRFAARPHLGRVDDHLRGDPCGKGFFHEPDTFYDKLPGLAPRTGAGLQVADVLDGGVFGRSEHRK